MNNERFEGFLESSDLMQCPPVRLTIAGVSQPGSEKAKDGRVIDKPIIAFEGTNKRMILGKTNERLIKSLHGARPADWAGKTIVIGVRYLASAFGFTNVPTIRVILPKGAPMPFSCNKHYGSAKPAGVTNADG